MRKIVGFYCGPFSGTDAVEGFIFPDDYTDSQILAYLEGWAWDHHNDWVEDDDYLIDPGPDYYFEDYAPEKHDMLASNGVMSFV